MNNPPDPGPARSRAWFTAALRRALRHNHLDVSGCDRLSAGTYRLSLTGVSPASVVVKHVEPAVARLCRRLAGDWLPAVGLADTCPPLLAVIGSPERPWTVHTWLDGGQLDPYSDQVCEWVDLVATLHIRCARPSLLTELRQHCRYLGPDHQLGQLDGAQAALQAVRLQPPARAYGLIPVVSELSQHVRAERRQAPGVLASLRDTGGPDTLLHGDLWPQNAVAAPDRVRLVDWDHMGVGPAIYDLSTLLLRLPPTRRQGALDHYLSRLVAAGWPRPSTEEVVRLSIVAERARLATLIPWRVRELWQSGPAATWAAEELRAIHQWWAGVDPRPRREQEVRSD